MTFPTIAADAVQDLIFWGVWQLGMDSFSCYLVKTTVAHITSSTINYEVSGMSLALDRWPVVTWFGLRATYFWILLARTGHLSLKFNLVKIIANTFFWVKIHSRSSLYIKLHFDQKRWKTLHTYPAEVHENKYLKKYERSMSPKRNFYFTFQWAQRYTMIGSHGFGYFQTASARTVSTATIPHK